MYYPKSKEDSLEGWKRLKRTSVHGSAIEGEWEEVGKATLAHYDLSMQQLIARNRNNPTWFFPEDVFHTNRLIVSTNQLDKLGCLFKFLVPLSARASAHAVFWCLWCRGFQSPPIKTQRTIIIPGQQLVSKWFPFRRSTSSTVSPS